jgi:hypothetical protein
MTIQHRPRTRSSPARPRGDSAEVGQPKSDLEFVAHVSRAGALRDLQTVQPRILDAKARIRAPTARLPKRAQDHYSRGDRGQDSDQAGDHNREREPPNRQSREFGA